MLTDKKLKKFNSEYNKCIDEYKKLQLPDIINDQSKIEELIKNLEQAIEKIREATRIIEGRGKTANKCLIIKLISRIKGIIFKSNSTELPELEEKLKSLGKIKLI